MSNQFNTISRFALIFYKKFSFETWYCEPAKISVVHLLIFKLQIAFVNHPIKLILLNCWNAESTVMEIADTIILSNQNRMSEVVNTNIGR